MQIELEHIIEPLLPNIKKIRQKLHSHPELGFVEDKTSEMIFNALKEFHLEIKTGIGKTGLIAILDTGKPGKTIGFRADFDALAIQEKNEFSYASKNKSKMHACGHDGHTAILICVAGALSAIKDKLTGKIIFIFNPLKN